jgi:hypothetical protein
MRGGQLSLEIAPSCKVRGCGHPVVGSSTTGEGHVCRGHNEAEWGRALREYDPPLSARLLEDSARNLEVAAWGAGYQTSEREDQ